ncbi:helix-turn-helix domain-containing protein [Aquimarina sp. BL5]|uniref:tetratricopeptide repeat protein n=1 Tax=Aquimarina sp. BL5 TaxID=1714860 RepID=UPI000E4FE981|nr:tetratricopeptide repeat protein [Aquimarina sp. BL5]AXT51703.1 helix-turn-helix domain-containing protein [Aquimarina sp. BL5]RKN08795.1 helix-turn-helix domain-containing protein [Aquimarina sp. BL5]
MKQFLLKFILLTPLFLLGNTLTNANQSNTQDSLATKSPQELIEHLIQSSNSKQSKPYEVALSNLFNDNSILAEHYYSVSDTFYEKGKYDRSIYYLDKAIKSVKGVKNDSLLCKYFIASGNSYLKDWKNQESLDYYNKALNIAQSNGYIRNEFITNSSISIILRRMGQLDKALKVCKNSLKLTENSIDKNTENHVRLINIISEIYLDQKKYDSANHYADIGLIMSKSLDFSIGSIDLYTKKGVVYSHKNDNQKALLYFHKAEEILIDKKITQKKSILNINYFLANHFYEEKKYNKAISYLNNTIPILEEKDARNSRVLDTYILLANCYSKIGKTNEAMHWLQKLIKLKDQFEDAKHKTITKLHKQEIHELENRMEIITNEEMKEERYKEYTFFLLLSVCIILIFIVFKYFKKQKTNNARFNELLGKINSLEPKEKNLVQAVIINDKKVNAVLDGLEKLENQEYFLNTDCDLRSLSKKVKTNTTYLSKIIKTHKAASFNDYINDLRIEYALKRLKNDKKFRSFSVKSIALEIGYKTDNSFTKHFKSKTGLNPSYYIKKINNQYYNS